MKAKKKTIDLCHRNIRWEQACFDGRSKVQRSSAYIRLDSTCLRDTRRHQVCEMKYGVQKVSVLVERERTKHNRGKLARHRIQGEARIPVDNRAL